MNLNKYIDHTLLKADANIEDVKKICREAVQYKFYSVCINPCYVKLAKRELENTEIKICAVVGFPLGADMTDVKVREAEMCIDNGADEIDMVINIGILKSGDLSYIENEIVAVKKIIGNKILKVIIETCYLTNEEKISVSRIVEKAGADFVKTSTGFGTKGATFEDVIIIKEAINNRIKIKASGGIKGREEVYKYLSLGVERIGTSNGIAIIDAVKSDSNY